MAGAAPGSSRAHGFERFQDVLGTGLAGFGVRPLGLAVRATEQCDLVELECLSSPNHLVLGIHGLDPGPVALAAGQLVPDTGQLDCRPVRSSLRFDAAALGADGEHILPIALQRRNLEGWGIHEPRGVDVPAGPAKATQRRRRNPV